MDSKDPAQTMYVPYEEGVTDRIKSLVFTLDPTAKFSSVSLKGDYLDIITALEILLFVK